MRALLRVVCWLLIGVGLVVVVDVRADHEHTWQDTGPAETKPCFKPRNLGGGPGSKSCTPQKCACGKTQNHCGACQ